MSKQGTIRRYTLIIEKINNKQFPSFELIKDCLWEHGFQISKRTLQRDVEDIRYEFGLDIKYARSKNGYYFDEESSINIESFFRFLEIANTAELLTESLADCKDTLKYILFGNSGTLKGIEHLKPLLTAIKDKRIVTFAHYNFHTGKTKKHTLMPYLLKEYLNRWYVVGKVNYTDEFRIFGIDRIENLEVKDETFKPDTKQNPAELFEQTIGIIYSGKKQQRVVLSFTPTQGKYVKTLPLHNSQIVIVDNTEECRIAIYVVPNYELTQKILMHHDTVKVIEPQWLADEIKEILKNTLKQYDQTCQV